MYTEWLRGDVMVAVSQIMVTVCIMFSVPILHYPCRFSMWTLLHQLCPKGKFFENISVSRTSSSRTFRSKYCLESKLQIDSISSVGIRSGNRDIFKRVHTCVVYELVSVRFY